MATNDLNPQPTEDRRLPLTRRNYVILLAGFGLVLLGFVLMTGGSSAPGEFNEEMFSWRRITLAPILVIGGFAVEIYGIMKRFDK